MKELTIPVIENYISVKERPNIVYSHGNDLKDDRWIAKRKKVKCRAKNKCSSCGFEGVLDVHHLYYVKGKHLWEYPFRVLIPLCRACHTKWHEDHDIEYRAEVWSEHKDYQAPNKQKVYFVTKGKKSVKKLQPYTKQKKQGCSMRTFEPLTPLEKARRSIKKRVKAGTFKPTFSPIPEWRKNKTE